MIERATISEAWKPPLAKDWNDIADMVDGHHRGGATASKPFAPPRQRKYGVVWLRNDTGGDLLAGRVMEIGAALLDEITNDYPWFEGDTWGESGLQGFAISLNPMLAGDIDECQAAGIVLARVNLTDTSHRFAEPATGSTILHSGNDGRCEIMWLPAPVSTGEQDAFVRIGAGSGGNEVYFGKLDSTIANGATGTMSIWCDGSDSGSDMTVTNRTGVSLLSNILMEAKRGVGCTEYLVRPYELDECEV
jgi:hypothetical protein